MMCTALQSEDIFVISDDDEDEGYNHNASDSEPSLIIMDTEPVPKKVSRSSSKVDEELIVTFFRPAEVLPHARFNCPKHPFIATDNCSEPVPGNELLCEQCFCYICDKQATMCEKWHVSGLCHCNSHKKSDFWNTQRNVALMGHLTAFNFTLSEVDGQLRQAESMLHTFKKELRTRLESIEAAVGNRFPHHYTPIHECVLDFMHKAGEQGGRGAAVLRLVALQELIPLLEVVGSSVTVPIQSLMASLQRQMITDEFTSEFRQKLQNFFSTLSFPAQLKIMCLSLSMDVRPWDDILLVSVLKGQNVDGVRTNKGKKDTLIEPKNVVLLRVQQLLDQNRFRELIRYIRVVRTIPGCLSAMKDYIPFFMCMEGVFDSALASFFQSCRGSALRLTAEQFHLYLRVLETATAPKVSIDAAWRLHITAGNWCPIKGAVPLARTRLVRFALKVLKACPNSRINSTFWIHLLTSVLVTQHTQEIVPEPSATFLQEAKHVVPAILNDESSDLRIPPDFVSTFPDQALLLLVIVALSDILQSLSPIIPLLCLFEKCMWALYWFWENMLPSVQYRVVIIHKIYRELVNKEQNPPLIQIQSVKQVVWPSGRYWDQHLQLKDFFPILLCLEGKTNEALRTFFPEKGPAAHLMPHTFQLYFHIFRTSTVPKMTLSQNGELCGHWGAWNWIEGAVPLNRSKLVSFALKVFKLYPDCCTNTQCWISLLNLVTVTDSLGSIPEPSCAFMNEAVNVTNCVLSSCNEGVIPDYTIPQHFLKLFPDQAFLLLVTKYLRQIILVPALRPIIPILSIFRSNLWALRWFWEYLSSDNCHNAIREKILLELSEADGGTSIESIDHLLNPPCIMGH
ncbi:uncharacterized protein LOC144198653 [Stigmatopora nigra]